MAHAAIAYAKTHAPPPRACRHLLDRPGRDQHGDRRGARARQPPAGAVHPRRRLRQPRAPTRCCSRSRTSTTARSRPTTASARSRRYFDRITRPEHLLTALPRALRDDDRPGRLRPGHASPSARTCRPRPTTTRAASSSRSVWRIRRPEPDPVEVAEVVAGDPRRRSAPVIVAGGGVLYSGRRGRCSPTSPSRRNIPVVETQAGKGATAPGTIR